jgi:hypothetical protein
VAFGTSTNLLHVSICELHPVVQKRGRRPGLISFYTSILANNVIDFVGGRE